MNELTIITIIIESSWTIIHHHEPLLATINHYCYLLSLLNINEPLLATINHYCYLLSLLNINELTIITTIRYIMNHY